jgi:hypothetical protein
MDRWLSELVDLGRHPRQQGADLGELVLDAVRAAAEGPGFLPQAADLRQGFRAVGGQFPDPPGG